MPYVTTIPVVFPYPVARVFKALCDIDRFPLWNSGMILVEHDGPMREGLRYRTEVQVPGAVNVSNVQVLSLVENQELALASETGAISFQARFLLSELTPDRTEVMVTLRFQFHSYVFDLARPVLESMAKARLKGDLEALRALMAAEPPTEP